ncbi:MAG TPA: hypothetical protein VN040_26095 [Pseudosphingobacterium sp.]|nr:hypothetical protein [Pseudosphingobacterium sp.]
MIKKSLSILLLGGFAVACNNGVNENHRLQTEIIAVHDSVMPMMGTFVRDNIKAKSLLIKMDSLHKILPDLDTLKEKEELSKLQLTLSDASEAMTDWMHNFEPAPENKNADEVKTYLESELKKVKTLKDKFAAAEQQRKQILEKYNK